VQETTEETKVLLSPGACTETMNVVKLSGFPNELSVSWNRSKFHQLL